MCSESFIFLSGQLGGPLIISNFLVKEMLQIEKNLAPKQQNWLTVFPGNIRKMRKNYVLDFDIEEHFFVY